MTRTIKETFLTEADIKKHGLEWKCRHENAHIFGKGNERYIMMKLLAYRDRYQIVHYFEVNGKEK